MPSAHDSPPPPSDFALQQPARYAQWRDAKLYRAEAGKKLLQVHIRDPERIEAPECDAIRRACARTNFALVRFATPLHDPPVTLGRLGDALGLVRRDRHLCADDSGFSRLSVRETATDNEYIPYTNRRLNWHTDGYYHPPARRIHAWLLYCAQDAAEGGRNALLDHEIAYLRLRDHDPDLAAALTCLDALTIPANVEQGGRLVRPAQTGAVFSDLGHGRLHMRYSARQRYVAWRSDSATRAAAAFLLRLLEDGDEFLFEHRLAPGEALISNNVLHCRTAFTDDAPQGAVRLLYRARYFDRVTGS